jgi:Protein of unknown function (DUF2867)
LAPADSVIADWNPSAYLLDSTRSMWRRRGVRACANWCSVYSPRNPPGWICSYGCETLLCGQLHQKQPAADHIAFFSVLNEQADEIVLGAHDRHFDFRLSLIRNASDNGEQLVMTTVVQVHNLLGRVYIQAIRPFHHLVVKRTMLRLAGSMERSSQSGGFVSREGNR